MRLMNIRNNRKGLKSLNIKDLSCGAREELNVLLKTIAQVIDEPFVILDKDLSIKLANKAFFKLFKTTKKETYSQYFHDIINSQFNTPEIKNYLRKILHSSSRSQNFKLGSHFEQLEGKTMELIGRLVSSNQGLQLTLIVFEDLTDKKKLDKEVKHEKEFSRQLIDNSIDGILAFDLNYRLTLWNPGMERIFGVCKKEVLGKHLFEILPFLKEAGEDKSFIDTLAGKNVTCHERPYFVAKTGRRGFFEPNYSPLKDVSGKVIGGLGIIKDITEHKMTEDERKSTEEALKESKSKYRDLYDSLRDGIVKTDMKGKILECNQSYSEMLGYRKNEIKNLTYQMLTPPKWHKMEEKIVKNQIIKRGYSDVYEKEYIKKDGTVFPVNLRVWLVKNEQGEPDRTWAIVRDITEHKRIDEALRESEAKFRSVMQSAHDAIISTDSVGKIIFWNRGAEVIFGYTEKEVFGRTLEFLMPKSYQPQHREGLRRVNATGKSHIFGKTVEMRGLRKDGSEFPLELSLALWKMREKIFYTGIIRDITERKELERRKDEFISTASHELKTPITSMKIFTEILQKIFEKNKDKQTIHYLLRIDEQIDRLTNLVNGLLDVSRIQSGRLSLRKEWFSLKKIIRETVEIFQATTKAHKMIIQGKMKGRIFADKGRINQVIINLLSNAIDYSPKDSKIIVTIRASKNIAFISIKDYGSGIAKKHQEKIFDPFYRVSEIGTKSAPGLGMGLYISAGIIRQHGGGIGVKSGKGKGSTFYFTIPIQVL